MNDINSSSFVTATGERVAGAVPMSVDPATGTAYPGDTCGIATGQVTVGVSPGTLIVAKRVGRKSVTIVQLGTTLVYLGASGVTAATGVPLAGTAYTQFVIPGGGAVYGLVATGTEPVAFIESF